MKMKPCLYAALAAACVVFAQGCATRGALSPTPGTAAPTHEGAPVPASLAASLLNVQVAAPANDAFTHEIGRAVRGRLARDQFQLAEEMPDLRVLLEASHKTFDQSGNYWVFDGTVNASVVRAFDQKLLGRESLTVRGERRLGREEALRDLRDRLANQAAEWVSRTAASGSTGLAAHDITLRRPALSRVWKDDSEYAKLVVREIGKMDGVLSCVVAQQDFSTHVIVFRVVYYAGRFPEGLMNRLATMNQLDIKPSP